MNFTQKLAYAIGYACAVLIASHCKLRRVDRSEAKQLFRQDIPGADGNQRVVGVDPNRYPFIVALPMGCAGVVLDNEAGIGMTAFHCELAKGDHFCHGSPKNLRIALMQAGHGSRSGDLQAAVGIKNCPIEGVVTGIVGGSETAELDYTIFTFKLNHPELRGKLQTARLLADSESLKRLNVRGLPTNAPKVTIEMTGYPGDEYAGGLLTASACYVQSGQMPYPYSQDRLNYIKTLEMAWSRPNSVCAQYPVECGAARSCFVRLASRNILRFAYDCSVYGGNSGGPIYYFDPLTGEPIVIGMPSTYLMKPPYPEDKCASNFRAKFIDPFVDFEAMKKAPSSVGTVPSWNQSDRPTLDPRLMPMAVPMPNIVRDSPFLQKFPKMLKLSFEEEIQRSIGEVDGDLNSYRELEKSLEKK